MSLQPHPRPSAASWGWMPSYSLFCSTTRRRPPASNVPAAAPAPKRRKLGSDAIFGIRVGTDELDRLWNLTEDNLSGEGAICTSVRVWVCGCVGGPANFWPSGRTSWAGCGTSLKTTFWVREHHLVLSTCGLLLVTSG